MPDLAVTVDCSKCQARCCGSLSGWQPALMPWEVPARFFGLTDRRGKIYVVRQRKTGHCIFFDKQRCSVYERRPLECRLFPFRLKFSKCNVQLEIDRRCVQHTLFSRLSANRLMEGLAGRKFPASWVKQYVAYRE